MKSTHVSTFGLASILCGLGTGLGFLLWCLVAIGAATNRIPSDQWSDVLLGLPVCLGIGIGAGMLVFLFILGIACIPDQFRNGVLLATVVLVGLVIGLFAFSNANKGIRWETGHATKGRLGRMQQEILNEKASRQ